MPRITDALIIGAGQAGLAMSQTLSGHGIDHVVLERGRVAERWHSERWDSLRLLTPNWMSRLPGGWQYRGADPDGFMAMPEVIEHLQGYAQAVGAPVETGCTVRSVRRTAGGYAVDTLEGASWRARAVIIATGQCDEPAVPAMAAALPQRVQQVVPSAYRKAAQLPSGGTLVVGASATGIQLAEEIHRSGRPVTLAVGNHTRLPRRWRGRDIMDWMERAGVLGETAAQQRDLAAARRQPSLQLVGRPDNANRDLGTLHHLGVRLTGRLRGIDGTKVVFADDLAETTGAAERRLQRLLARIAPVAAAEGAPDEPAPTPPVLPTERPTSLDLAEHGISSVVWATGYRQLLTWLQVPGLCDAAGELRHDGGLTAAPGLFLLGLRFMRTRRSSFIDGVGADAEALAWHVLAHLLGRAAA